VLKSPFTIVDGSASSAQHALQKNNTCPWYATYDLNCSRAIKHGFTSQHKRGGEIFFYMFFANFDGMEKANEVSKPKQ